MAEVLVQYSDVVVANSGTRFLALACGAPVESGHWHGWLEFIDAETGAAVRSRREITQPIKTDTV